MQNLYLLLRTIYGTVFDDCSQSYELLRSLKPNQICNKLSISKWTVIKL